MTLHIPDAEHEEEPILKADRGQVRGSLGSSRYQIVGEIATGGVGVVYKGRDTDLGRDVAMKVLRDDLKGNADMVQRFVEEAQIGGQLQHPDIVPVYELGLHAGQRPYYSSMDTTMSLTRGGSPSGKPAAPLLR